MLTIAIAGKPNSGKSTFFKACTLVDVEIAPYPFTTISPNVGIAHARIKCACNDLLEEGGECGNCVSGIRFLPVQLIDVAGLVKGAHEGKGLGNEFLDNLRQAETIIHVVDASGGTDADGNIVPVGSHDPGEDIAFFFDELKMWVYGIINRNRRKIERKAELEGAKIEWLLSEQLAGVGVNQGQINAAISKSGISATKTSFKSLNHDDLKNLSGHIIKESKKMIIAANKMDIAPEENIQKLKQFEDEDGVRAEVIPCSAAAELALRTAARNHFIKYLPGDADFELLHDVTEKQKAGLTKIKELMMPYGGTGLQDIINKVVFDLSDRVVVYPVEDENKFTDSAGRVLPDAYLMKRGSIARDLAFAIHSDIGKGFLFAVDARTKRRLGEKYALQNNNVIRVVYAK